MDDSERATLPIVRVICGPTGAGKTVAAVRFATRLAHETPVSIISADSRQLYRGFDIGTAKPSAADRQHAPHLGIDVLDPTERASAATWARLADGWIHEVMADGRIPLVVGGTGLYLRALFAGLFEEPAMDPERRPALQALLEDWPVEELRQWVAALDPARAHLGRTQLLRAIEVALLTGHRISALHRAQARPPSWRARYLVVDPGPRLAGDIETRARSMLAEGWADEVRSLLASVPLDAAAWNATGYRAIVSMVQGGLSVHDAEQRVVIETRQYAKRQRTWFRHQLVGDDVTRLDPRAPDFAARADAWWDGAIA